MYNYNIRSILVLFSLLFFLSQPYAQIGDTYPLGTCLVSGEKIGTMGEAIIYNHQGRELRFCCEGCIPKFKKSSSEYLAKLDAIIIAEQLPFYPLDTCLISHEKLGSMGEAINYVYNNRLIRFCCKGCIRDFLKEPAKYLAELNKAVVLKQKAKYPLDRCLVSRGKLGEMGEPFEFVYGNRLIRFCCKDCLPKFQKQPALYLSYLKKAYDRKK